MTNCPPQQFESIKCVCMSGYYAKKWAQSIGPDDVFLGAQRLLLSYVLLLVIANMSYFKAQTSQGDSIRINGLLISSPS